MSSVTVPSGAATSVVLSPNSGCNPSLLRTSRSQAPRHVLKHNLPPCFYVRAPRKHRQNRQNQPTETGTADGGCERRGHATYVETSGKVNYSDLCEIQSCGLLAHPIRRVRVTPPWAVLRAPSAPGTLSPKATSDYREKESVFPLNSASAIH